MSQIYTIFQPEVYAGVTCSERHESNQGTSWSADRNRNRTRIFQVMVLNRRQAFEDFVCQHPEIPKPWSFYTTPFGDFIDSECLLIKTSAVCENGTGETSDWQSWIVTCEYSTQMPPGGPQDNNQNQSQSQGNSPELQKCEVHWESETVMRAIPYDLNRVVYNNSSFTPYKPAIMTKLVRPVLTVIRNELSFGLTKIQKYGGATNSTPLLGRAPGKAECAAPVGTEMWYGNTRYWRVSYRITFGARFPITAPIRIRQFLFDLGEDPAAGAFSIFTEQEEYEWMRYEDVLDEGFCELSPNDGNPHANKPIPIKRNGHTISTPMLLDGHGHPIDFDANGPNVQPVFNRYTKLFFEDLTALLQGGGPNGSPFIP